LLFNSAIFLFAFLPACLGIFLILQRHAGSLQVPWLLLCSLVFYAWWSTIFLALFMVSALVNWGTARLLARAWTARRMVLLPGACLEPGPACLFQIRQLLHRRCQRRGRLRPARARCRAAAQDLVLHVPEDRLSGRCA
jgi:hypothetical protein